MNKPKTFTKRYFYYSLLSSFSLSLMAFISMFFLFQANEESEQFVIDKTIVIICLIISLVIYLTSIIYNYFYYKTSNYYFNDKGIVCKKGFLFKKTSLIEYTKIHTVNKKQGLVQKLFDIAFLLIDSGATQNSEKEEIIIIERSFIIDDLIKTIKEKQEEGIEETSEEKEKKEQTNLYNFTSKTKFIYSLLTVLSAIFIVTIVIIIFLIGITTLSKWINFEEGGVIMLIWMIVLGYIGISCVSFIRSIIISMVGFYNFSIYRDNKTITISYGLFEKNNNSFNIDRIKAVIVKTGIIKRLFNYVTIELEVIGYSNNDSNNEKGKEKVFIPLCHKREVNNYIERIIGSDYLPTPKMHNCKSYLALWSWKVLITTLIIAFIYALGLIWILTFDKALLLPISLICLLVTIVIDFFIIVTSYLKYRFEGISINNDTICLYHGGVFQKTTVFLKRHIIGIEEVATPRRKQKKISTYIIHFRSNADDNEAIVEIQDESLKTELLNSLKY